jgi:hypothetical protein
LAFNGAYGLIGLLYAGLMRSLRTSTGAAHGDWAGQMVENEAFRASIGWFPWYLALALALVVVALMVFWHYSSADKDSF